MNSLFERPFTFDRVTRIVFSIVIIGVLLYLITVLRNALLPFLIAWAARLYDATFRQVLPV